MAVVVEQTIPFTPQSLQLEKPERWNKLIPLMRPSVRRQQLGHGHSLLVDTARQHQDQVSVVVVDRSGGLTSKYFSVPGVVAIACEQNAGGRAEAEEIAKTLGSHSGLVILRSGERRVIDSQPNGVIVVELKDDLELDHVLHLLGHLKKDVGASIKQVDEEVLRTFLSSAKTVHSTFHPETVDSQPAVAHGDNTAAYEQAKHAVEKDLKALLTARVGFKSPVTYSVHYSDVNGLSKLENNILGYEIANLMNSQSLPYSLSSSALIQHEKLDRGFGISICPLSQSVLDPQSALSAPLNDEHTTSSSSSNSLSSSKITFHDAAVRARIESGCQAVISEEPTITKYDEIVGDGDCGYTLRDGAKQVLAFIKDKDLSKLPQVVSDLVHDLEVNMGGTSGALYCIFLTSFSSALATEQTIADALDSALQQLLKYTRARLGDRTMLDCLIPFVDELKKEGDASNALAVASEGVDRTKDLKASLGRSTYLDESATKGVPDPGAYGLLVLLRGMCK